MFWHFNEIIFHGCALSEKSDKKKGGKRGKERNKGRDRRKDRRENVADENGTIGSEAGTEDQKSVELSAIDQTESTDEPPKSEDLTESGNEKESNDNTSKEEVGNDEMNDKGDSDGITVVIRPFSFPSNSGAVDQVSDKSQSLNPKKENSNIEVNEQPSNETEKSEKETVEIEQSSVTDEAEESLVNNESKVESVDQNENERKNDTSTSQERLDQNDKDVANDKHKEAVDNEKSNERETLEKCEDVSGESSASSSPVKMIVTSPKENESSIEDRAGSPVDAKIELDDSSVDPIPNPVSPVKVILPKMITRILE